jgi:hypothetical protein
MTNPRWEEAIFFEIQSELSFNGPQPASQPRSLPAATMRAAATLTVVTHSSWSTTFSL